MNCQVIKYRGISVLILLPRVTRPNLKLETERSLGLLTLSIRISARLDDAKSKYCIHRRPFIMRIASTNNPYRSDSQNPIKYIRALIQLKPEIETGNSADQRCHFVTLYLWSDWSGLLKLWSQCCLTTYKVVTTTFAAC